MKAILRHFSLLTLVVASCVQIQAAPPPANKPACFWLTLDLRDGSRIVGKSLDASFRFRSGIPADANLPLQNINSIECQAHTNLATLTTSNGNSLEVGFAMMEIPVETAFGNIQVPVSLIKSVKVSAFGKNGKPMDGLIGLWSGNGNAVDSVGGNNGVLQNVGFTKGVVGQAFSFVSGSIGNYTGVQIPDEPAYELTNSLTIEGWIRPRANGYVVFFRGDNRPGLDPYCLSMDGNQNLLFQICAQDGTTASAQTPVCLGAWIHVAGVLNDSAGTVNLYTNGVLAAQTVTTVRPFGELIAEDSPGIGIGNVNDGFNNFPFFGDIDEVALYDRALSHDEVNAIYAENAANAGSLAEPLPTQ